MEAVSPPPYLPRFRGRGVWGGANRDGGAGRWPAPCVRLTAFRAGSGWAGGQCHGEWIDRWLADEEAEYFADFVWFQL